MTCDDLRDRCRQGVDALLMLLALPIILMDMKVDDWKWRRKGERHTTTEPSGDAGTPGDASPGSA